MGAVTVAAGGREAVAAGGGPPVKAGGVLGLLVGVACAAIDARQFFGVGEFFLGELGVAGRALQIRMRGGAQSRGIDRRRGAFFAFTRARPGVVAGKTFFGPGERFGRLGQRCGGQHPSRDQAQNPCRVPRVEQHGIVRFTVLKTRRS